MFEIELYLYLTVCKQMIDLFTNVFRMSWDSNFVLVSLFNGISTLVGYFLPKYNGRMWYYLTHHSGEHNTVHIFHKNKRNREIGVRTHLGAAEQHFSHYTIKDTLPQNVIRWRGNNFYILHLILLNWPIL